jgi:enamine deaminase RidA (YjgF/YER057c/UK114 family)
MSMINKQGCSRRLSQTAIHNGTVYLSGQTSQLDAGIAEQANDVFQKIDRLLSDAGTNRTRLLWAQIWLTDMDDFDAMNLEWETWLKDTEPPVRACVHSVLAKPGYKIEVQVIAAV